MKKQLAITTVAIATFILAACEEREEQVRYYCVDGNQHSRYCIYTNDPDRICRQDPNFCNMENTARSW